MGIEERADAAYSRILAQRHEREELATREIRPRYVALINTLHPLAARNLRSNIVPVRGSLSAYYLYVETFRRGSQTLVRWGGGSNFETAQITEDGLLDAQCQSGGFAPEKCTHLRHLRGMAQLLHIVANATPSGPQRHHLTTTEMYMIGSEFVCPPLVRHLSPAYPVQEVRELVYRLSSAPPQPRRRWFR